jgi:hypothetical protein
LVVVEEVEELDELLLEDELELLEELDELLEDELVELLGTA